MKLCECGCGNPAPIAKYTDKRWGHVKGQRSRFIHGHNPRIPVNVRFWAQVERRGDTECWEWKSYHARDGYGRLQAGRHSPVLAHRFAYELLVGPIPEGLTLDHLCRNRRCVNPFHLEPVTMRENILRGEGATAINARKTHCKRGHELNAENTYLYSRSNQATYRACRVCVRAKARERWRRAREAK